MVVKAKLHGWLVGALAGAGYQQRDLARAWRVDDAVVSRFIGTGKPDLTPERQMMLAQMLGLTNDQLLAQLYGDPPARTGIPLRPPQPIRPAVALTKSDTVEAEIRRAVERLEQLLPGARVSIHITYERRGE
jgi:hypothetical protein